MTATDKIEETSEERFEREAWRALGRALLRPLERTGELRPGTPEALEAVMDGFAAMESDPQTSGGVCLPVDSLEKAAAARQLSDSGLARPMAQASGEGGLLSPLVWDEAGERLYLERRFSEEKRLADAVASFARGKKSPLDDEMRRAAEAFIESDRQSGRDDPDHDRAVKGALRNRLTVITGGPGTGKTTVVVRIIACLLAKNPGLVIAGAAPTGKAASNLAGSILEALPWMEKGGGELERLAGLVRGAGIRCQTLHRWLSEQRRIDADVLVVDECSMMDIDLASRLFDALDPARTRVLLLGDKDQLAAVGPGSVFADLSDKAGPLAPCIFGFTKNHRFGDDSRLYRLARAITPRSGEVDEKAVFDVLEAPNQAGDNAIDWEKTSGRASGGVSRGLQAWLRDAYGFLLHQGKNGSLLPLAGDAEGVDRLWAQADSVRVLSSVHVGENGTDAVNAFMEKGVRKASGAEPEAIHYPGRLIIVTKNSRALGLSNGDTAVELQNGEKGLVAWFGALGLALPVALLPQHESAFAITIHKSQGSAYHNLAVCLPEGGGEKIGSRELLYTAVTRLADRGADKGRLTLFAGRGAVAAAVGRRVMRSGGLSDRLKAALEAGEERNS
ncbi:AAA family ATPase [Mesosutterella sp. AGMB02718]|uniref:AAA family ATPase n=1 Tax=Mesosutterella faecium TaxID=2925194 RepID=A0ABT7IQB2_9BURK|nr:AAA family ATPase [Mesosutterella sp. AGMB02718]MDL2060076.1 AAA family ATPase [Mesosutterella sp. AGMB02718]